MVGVILQVVGKHIHLLTPAIVVGITELVAEGEDQVSDLVGDIFLEQIHLLFFSFICFDHKLIKLCLPRPVVAFTLGQCV